LGTDLGNRVPQEVGRRRRPERHHGGQADP